MPSRPSLYEIQKKKIPELFGTWEGTINGAEKGLLKVAAMKHQHIGWIL